MLGIIIFGLNTSRIFSMRLNRHESIMINGQEGGEVEGEPVKYIDSI